MILIQLLILALVIMFALKINKPKTTVISFEHEHLIKDEPIFNSLPKGPIRNSHWFTHTFMRSRRKG